MNYNDLLNLRSKIVELYYKTYNDYIIESPTGLEDKHDITLDFTNCTICLAKENILKEKIGNNYVVCQPCLRNNNFQELSDVNKELNYMNYFTMLGGYHYIKNNSQKEEEFNKIVKRQYKFLKEVSNGSKIRLTIPSQFEKYLKLSKETMTKIKSDNNLIEYQENELLNLKWKYGIDGIIGYGTRWEVQNINGEYVNCGNDILLYKNNRAIGIDFGSGLETLVSLLNGEKNLLYSNKVCSDKVKKFCSGNAIKEKIVNALVSLICCKYYKSSKTIRVEYIIGLYIRIIAAYLEYIDCDTRVIIELSQDICTSLCISNNEISEIYLQILKQRAFINSILLTQEAGKFLLNNEKMLIESRKKEWSEINEKTRKIKKRR